MESVRGCQMGKYPTGLDIQSVDQLLAVILPHLEYFDMHYYQSFRHALFVKMYKNGLAYAGIYLINIFGINAATIFRKLDHFINATVRIRHQCRKNTVLSCHRCLINSGVEKMNI